MVKIYHNPRCRKSREALELLNKKNKKVEVIEYLKTPPNKAELSKIIQQLEINAEDLIRKNEDLFKKNFKGQQHDDETWIQIMVENPKLIERPIVITPKGARIGRPPEKVLEIV